MKFFSGQNPVNACQGNTTKLFDVCLVEGGEWGWGQEKCKVSNRPGRAGAVLQTPLLFNNSLYL